jgi:hypothetical protein
MNGYSHIYKLAVQAANKPLPEPGTPPGNYNLSFGASGRVKPSREATSLFNFSNDFTGGQKNQPNIHTTGSDFRESLNHLARPDNPNGQVALSRLDTTANYPYKRPGSVHMPNLAQLNGVGNTPITMQNVEPKAPAANKPPSRVNFTGANNLDTKIDNTTKSQINKATDATWRPMDTPAEIGAAPGKIWDNFSFMDLLTSIFSGTPITYLKNLFNEPKREIKNHYLNNPQQIGFDQRRGVLDDMIEKGHITSEDLGGMLNTLTNRNFGGADLATMLGTDNLAGLVETSEPLIKDISKEDANKLTTLVARKAEENPQKTEEAPSIDTEPEALKAIAKNVSASAGIDITPRDLEETKQVLLNFKNSPRASLALAAARKGDADMKTYYDQLPYLHDKTPTEIARLGDALREQRAELGIDDPAEIKKMIYAIEKLKYVSEKNYPKPKYEIW